MIELSNYGAFCTEHFFELIRNRVKKTIQKYKKLPDYYRDLSYGPFDNYFNTNNVKCQYDYKY